ncbi:MAG: hypothetical protein NTZ83_05480 [Candidatus Pacearchaeota archaeon]|nr:hypothetical protein [Candidatus Pacearchaeota archaeon]
MKKYFLSYSTITKDYYLDYGCFDRDRVNLGKVEGEKLTKKLKDIIKVHRKTVLYSEITLDNSVKELLLKDFKNTSVKVQFAKNLESLC